MTSTGRALLDAISAFSDEVDGGVGAEEVEAAHVRQLPLNLFSCGGIVAALAAALFPSSVFPILFLGLMSNCATLPLSPSLRSAAPRSLSLSREGEGCVGLVAGERRGRRPMRGRTDGRAGGGEGRARAYRSLKMAPLPPGWSPAGRSGSGEGRRTEDGGRTEKKGRLSSLVYALPVPLASF